MRLVLEEQGDAFADCENRCRRMALEITKSLKDLLESPTEGSGPQIPQSVRELDPDMFNDLEKKISAMEREAVRREDERASGSEASTSVDTPIPVDAKIYRSNVGADVAANAETAPSGNTNDADDKIVDDVMDIDNVDINASFFVNGADPDISDDDDIPNEVDTHVDASNVADSAADSVADTVVNSETVNPNAVNSNTVDPIDNNNPSTVDPSTSNSTNTVDPVHAANSDVATDPIGHANQDAANVNVVNSAETPSPPIVNSQTADVGMETPVDAKEMRKTSSANVDRSPVVTVQCTRNITPSSESGGVVIDMAPKKSPQKSNNPREKFPVASTSSRDNPHQRACFTTANPQLNARALDTVDGIEFSDDEEGIPDESTISAMTQGHKNSVNENPMSTSTQKEKPSVDDAPAATESSQEGGLWSQLSEDTSIDLINGKINENGVRVEDEGVESGGENGKSSATNAEMEEEEGRSEEGEERVRDGGKVSEVGEERVEGGNKGVENETDWNAEGDVAAANLEKEIEKEKAAETPAAETPIKSLYSKTFVDEGDVTMSRNGAPALRLGPKNGIKLSELRRNQAEGVATQSVYTPNDPLMPDPHQKRQTIITDQFARVVGKQSTELVSSNNPRTSHSLQSSQRPLVEKENIPRQSMSQSTSSNGNVNDVSVPSAHHSATQKAPLSTQKAPLNTQQAPQRPSLSNGGNVEKSTPVVTQKSASRPTSPSTQRGGTAKSPQKRKSVGGFEYKSPKMPNLEFGSKSNELPIVKKPPTSIKKSKPTVTALPIRLTKKVCSYCYTPFLGKHKTLTPREHVVTGKCDFVKQNCVSIGVEKRCSQCDTQFVYGKSMYEEIITHFSEKNHDIVCYLCGLKLKFSDLFSHMELEVMKCFESGIQCKKCNSLQRSASDFYDHIRVYHSAKELNVSVFNRHLYDSHPNYNCLLVSLLLTHYGQI